MLVMLDDAALLPSHVATAMKTDIEPVDTCGLSSSLRNAQLVPGHGVRIQGLPFCKGM